MNLIAEGTSLSELEACEPLLSEGQKGEVRIYFDRSLSDLEIQQVEDALLSEEVVLTGPIQSAAGILVIPFQKAIPPLPIIVVVVGLIAATILGWQLMSTFAGIPVWMWLAGGGLLVWMLGRK